MLFGITLRAFQPDYEKYGVYPPLIKLKSRSFLPPRMFGKTIFDNGQIIGGAFVLGLGKKGEIGAVFLEPAHQHRGVGRKVMSMIEDLYPHVRRWRLETPVDNAALHRFYESLGYVKSGEMQDKKSGIRGFMYQKQR